MNKRTLLDRLPIDEAHLRKLMRCLFSRAPDQGDFTWGEVIDELGRFGTRTRKQVRRLLKKHRRDIIEIDRSAPDPRSVRAFTADFGEDFMRRYWRKKIWFSHAGLVRLALELEFQDAYRRFADERDGIAREA